MSSRDRLALINLTAFKEASGICIVVGYSWSAKPFTFWSASSKLWFTWFSRKIPRRLWKQRLRFICSKTEFRHKPSKSNPSGLRGRNYVQTNGELAVLSLLFGLGRLFHLGSWDTENLLCFAGGGLGLCLASPWHRSSLSVHLAPQKFLHSCHRLLSWLKVSKLLWSLWKEVSPFFPRSTIF